MDQLCTAVHRDVVAAMKAMERRVGHVKLRASLGTVVVLDRDGALRGCPVRRGARCFSPSSRVLEIFLGRCYMGKRNVFKRPYQTIS